jgi:hypothetical protein
MAFKARVYLSSGPEKSEARYIGEIDVTPRPIRNGRTVFTHAGKIETGHVEAVEPSDWDKTGTIPTIHVTLSSGK